MKETEYTYINNERAKISYLRQHQCIISQRQISNFPSLIYIAVISLDHFAGRSTVA